MKTIIAGSRTVHSQRLIDQAMEESGFEVTEVVSGGARGADHLGEMWAVRHKIPIKRFPANWDRYGRGAGMIRNTEMVKYADALVAVWDGSSRGTNDVIIKARKHDRRVYVKRARG